MPQPGQRPVFYFTLDDLDELTGSVAAEAEVMSLLGSETFSGRVASSKPVSAVISGDGFGCAALGSGEGGVLANFGGRIR